MGNHRYEEIRSVKGNKTHQICRTYLGAYRELILTGNGKMENRLEFAKKLIEKYTNEFNRSNTDGIANPKAIRQHLDALLAIAEGRIKPDKSYLEDLQDIYR